MANKNLMFNKNTQDTIFFNDYSKKNISRQNQVIIFYMLTKELLLLSILEKKKYFL